MKEQIINLTDSLYHARKKRNSRKLPCKIANESLKEEEI